MRGLVLEGVTASGKTTLFKHVQRELVARSPASTKVVLSEHYTDRLLEEPRKRGQITVDDAIRHVDDVLSVVRTLERLESGGKFAGRGGDSAVHVLCERWLGSHLAYLARSGIHPTAREKERIDALYRWMHGMGVRTVVLRLSADVLGPAVLKTRSHRTSAWRGFLASHGDDEGIVRAFTAWQDELLAFYGSLPEDVRPEIVDVPRPGDAGDAVVLATSLVDRLLS